jgi:hypothetical protein
MAASLQISYFGAVNFAIFKVGIEVLTAGSKKTAFILFTTNQEINKFQ